MKKILVGIALFAATTSICYGATQISYFARLQDADLEVRSSAYSSAYREHDERIKQLITLLENKPTKVTERDSWTCAVYLVGIYRATEAVRILVDNLTELPRIPNDKVVFMSEAPPLQYSYPCVSALVNIGEPSDVTPLLLEKITTTDNEEERRLATYVLMKVKGKDSLRSLLYTRKVELEKIREYKINIQKSLDYVRVFKAEYGILYMRENGEKGKLGGFTFGK